MLELLTNTLINPRACNDSTMSESALLTQFGLMTKSSVGLDYPRFIYSVATTHATAWQLASLVLGPGRYRSR